MKEFLRFNDPANITRSPFFLHLRKRCEDPGKAVDDVLPLTHF